MKSASTTFTFPSPHQLLVLSCLAAGLFFTFRATTTDVVAESPVAAASSTSLVTQDIEDICLGQRVVGTNPLREQTQTAADIDPGGVALTMKSQGLTFPTMPGLHWRSQWHTVVRAAAGE